MVSSSQVEAQGAVKDRSARQKRTRGPRSCLECRASKQRCEQINFADIVPSSEPQPLELACRRCKVLRLACIVPDQLPKSTRLRLEKRQSGKASTAAQAFFDPTQQRHAQPSASMSVHHPRASSSEAMGFSQAHVPSMPTFADVTLPMPAPPSVAPPTFPPPHAQAQAAQAQAHVSQFGGGASVEDASVHFFTSPPFTTNHYAQAQKSVSRSPSSNSLSNIPSSTSQFNPSIFDPLPAMKPVSGGGQAPESAAHQPTVSSSPSARGMSTTSSSSVRQSSGAVTMSQISDSPRSQISRDMDVSGEPSWYYRARVACRPMQLLEHLLDSHTPASHDRVQQTPTSSLSELEESVRIMLSIGSLTLMADVERRMLHIQRALPFMPLLPTCLGDIERSAFLLAVIMHIEGHLPTRENEVIFSQLTARCLYHVQNPPNTMFDIAALLVVANFCPLLLRPTAIVGVVSGSALLLSCSRSARNMDIKSAPTQLRAFTEQSQQNISNPFSSLPPLDSAVVQHAFLWLYITMQELMLDAIDDPMPTRSRSQHPRQGQQLFMEQQTEMSEPADAIDQYCRAILASKTTSIADSSRCGSMILLVFGARTTETARHAVKSFSKQFDKQVRQVRDAPARIMAMRRWVDQAVESMGVIMAEARASLQEIATFLGSCQAASATQLKYIELSLGGLEFSCLSQLKDKLYVIGHDTVGQTNTSQEFLFGLFSRPQLLRSFEAIGVVRACVARHVLILLCSLMLDLQPKKRRKESHSITAGNGESPLSHWGPLASVFPLARWCGMIAACVTVIIEELAGRFLAQESPLGAHGESRLELCTIIVRQVYDALIPFEDDALSRYPPHFQHQSVPGVTLDVIDKAMTALVAWRKKASGIGTYHLQGRPAQEIAKPASRVLDQVQFGDALLHDILFTPIEQFF